MGTYVPLNACDMVSSARRFIDRPRRLLDRFCSGFESLLSQWEDCTFPLVDEDEW